MTRSDYAVLALIVAGTMVSTALGVRIAGFELPPVAVFALVVLGPAIHVLLGVLPALGVRVPVLDATTVVAAAAVAAPSGPAESLAPLHPAL